MFSYFLKLWIKKILVSGVAGFVGMHTAKTLVASWHTVVGLNNLLDYTI